MRTIFQLGLISSLRDKHCHHMTLLSVAHVLMLQPQTDSTVSSWESNAENCWEIPSFMISSCVMPWAISTDICGWRPWPFSWLRPISHHILSPRGGTLLTGSHKGPLWVGTMRETHTAQENGWWPPREKSLFQRKVFENIHYTPPSYFHHNISVNKNNTGKTNSPPFNTL